MTETLKHRIGISLGALLLVASFLAYESSVFAATYTFTQSSWAGGADGASVAVHPTNVTNWSKYNSQTGLAANSTVSLSLSNKSVSDAGVALTPLATPTIAAGSGPRGMAISSDGASVYVSNYNGGAVSMYSRNTSTGALTALATPTIASGGAPWGITVSPDGISVYVANYSNNTVSMYSRNTSTGALTALATPTIASGSGPRGISISSDGTSVYTTNSLENTVSMYSRNTSTGALTALATPTIAAGAFPEDVSVSPDGSSVYVANLSGSNVSMYSRNTSTGALTALATPTIAAGGSPYAITVSPDGISVYVANSGVSTVSMYSRNTSTGALTALATPTIASGSGPQGITVSSDGTSVYVTNGSGNSISMYSRNTATGDLTSRIVSTVAAGGSPFGIAISSDGTSVYVANSSGNTVSMYKASISSGAAGFQAGTNSSTVISNSGAVTISTKGLLSPLSPATATTGATPYGTAISSDGSSVYVANSGANTVSMYSRNTSTGALTALATPTIATGAQPKGITVSADGTSVYVTNYLGTSISLYSRNTSTGALTALATSTVSTSAGSYPFGITISPDGTSVYSTDGNGSTLSMFSRNTSTGFLTSIGTTTSGTQAGGVVISSDGMFAYVANYGGNTISMYSRNTSTGVLTPLAPATIADSGGPNSVILSPDGTSLYTANNGTSAVVSMYSRNTSTGALTALVPATINAGASPQKVAISSDGSSVYSADYSDTIFIFSRNTSTGALSSVSSVALTSGSNLRDMMVSPDGASVYATNSGTNKIALYSRSAGATSGTFTSGVMDMSAAATFTTISLSATTPAGTGVTIDVRAGNTATPDGTWTAWTTGLASGASISALSGNRYVQYRLNLTTTDVTVTPTISSVAVGYSQYGTSGSLLSSVYDTGDIHNLIARLTWAETATTSADTIKFQVRSSLDNVTWSAWCGYADCSGSTYFTDGGGNGQDLANNHPLRVGNDDRYIQYKVFFASDGAGTPVLNSVSTKYVINASPDFDPTYGTNGVTVSQVATSTDPNWGKVNISYSVRDIDTNTGTINPGFITPSFEYSTNNGSTWLAIPAGDLRATDTTNKTVDTTIYTTYSAVWTASSTAPNIFNATVKIRVTANDNEAANNVGTATSTAIGLDTKAPTVTATFDASTGGTTGTVTLTTTDDSQSQYRLCNDPSFPATDAQSNSCAWSAFGANLTGSTLTWTPVKNGDGSETVYVQVRDAYSNLTAQTIVAPPAPANFALKDISNPSAGVYKEFLSWGVFTATTSASFASYRIYNSTDGTNFTQLATTTDPALNYYVHTVATGTTTTQYYKVVTTTTQGNVSPATAVLSDLPNGQGGTDTTPPVIDPASIIVPAQNLKNSSALVTFTTDELSKGTVQYRKSGTTPWTTVTSLSYVLAHSIYLQGLLPNTTYNVQVLAQDVAGNVSASVSGPDFTTAGGPLITSVSEASISDTAATIVWNTSTSSDSYVFYSQNQDLSNAISVGSATQVACTANLCQHKVTISSLAAGITYYFYVSSTDSQGNASTDTNGGSYYSFRTTVDTTPPVISAISEPVVSMTSAVIIWTTDEPSTSQVTWGTVSGSLTRATTADLTKTIYHVVTLSSQTNDTNGSAQGLTAITPYYFKVNSVDAAGNVASSPEQTFTTADAGTVRVITQFTSAANNGTGTANDTTPPTISSVTADNIGAFSADIHIATSKDTTTFVSYGPTTDYGSIEGNEQLASSKVVTLKRLQEGTTYHYRVKATDQYGTVVTDSDQTFRTVFASEELANLTSLEKATDLQGKIEQLIQSSLPSLAPPFITKPEVNNITENSATITWDTNIKSYGSLRYATDAAYLANKKDYKVEVSDGQAESASHSIDLTSLEPNTLYHVQARSYVFPQVVGMSPDLTFSTKAAAIVPNIVAVKNDGFTVVWQTNDQTSSTVTYRNVKTGERNITTDESKKTYHNVQIQNLPSGTTYTVSVSGVNDNGNMVSSDGALNVTTSVDLTPPVISNFKVDNALIPGRADLIQTVVGWQTDKPANSTVYYQEGAVSGTSASSTELKNKVESLDSYTTAHIMILASLKPGTVYSLKVVSQDQSGNTKVFGPTSIITPKQTQSVLDIIVKNFEDTFKFLGAGK